MKSLFRFLQIIHVLVTFHLDDLLKPLPYSLIPRLLLKLLPSYWIYYIRGLFRYSQDERARLALVELGPIFIKLGQLLATRRDLLDDALADELEKLTEQVPPFSGELALTIIKEELGSIFSESIVNFDSEPLAAASIAQVHTAELTSGEAVVFKVIRPGIEKTVERDLGLMTSLAKILENSIPDIQLVFPQELVRNYADVIRGELNLYREAANTIKFRKNALQHDLLYHAHVYPELSTRRVMCSERIYGIPVNQADAIAHQGTDLKQLAINGVKIFFTQVFKNNFFHADMHPGNIFVNTKNPRANQYVSVDCAIAGSLSNQDQIFLAQQLLAMIQKNYPRSVQLLIEAGWVQDDAHKEELAFRLQKIIDPIFGQDMSNIDFSSILFEMLALAREFRIQVSPNFLLFQKTLIHIEGLGKQLYPQLNVWEVGKPMIEDWVKELINPLNMAGKMIEQSPQLLQKLPEIPSLLLSSLGKIGDSSKVDTGEKMAFVLERIEQRQRRSLKSMGLALLFLGAAGFFASNLTLLELPVSSLILGGLGLGFIVFQVIK